MFAGCLPEMARAIKRWNCKACSVFKRLSHNPPFSRGGKHFCSPEGRRIQNEHKKSKFPRSHLDRGHQDPSGKAGAGESLLPSTILGGKGTACPAHSLLEHQAPGWGQSNCEAIRPCPLHLQVQPQHKVHTCPCLHVPESGKSKQQGCMECLVLRTFQSMREAGHTDMSRNNFPLKWLKLLSHLWEGSVGE